MSTPFDEGVERRAFERLVESGFYAITRPVGDVATWQRNALDWLDNFYMDFTTGRAVAHRYRRDEYERTEGKATPIRQAEGVIPEVATTVLAWPKEEP